MAMKVARGRGLGHGRRGAGSPWLGWGPSLRARGRIGASLRLGRRYALPTVANRLVPLVARALWRALLLAALALPAGIAKSEPVEAPTYTPEGDDVAYEANDSLASGEVELGLGLEGSASSKPVHRRRVRFDEPDFSGAMREGPGDPLAGGAVEGRGARSGFVAGKLSPRWGRGLLLGSPGEPWQRAATARDGGRRGRAGEGVMLSRGAEQRFELLAGRFARRDLAGARARHGAFGVGMLVGRGRDLQSSLVLRPGAGEVEAAIDRGGSWRAEGLLERSLAGWTTIGCVRAGSAAFRSLAEPTRTGPARSLTLTTSGPTRAGEARALLAVWRFRAGQAGARVGLECRRPLAAGGRLVWGLEEQHGARKESSASPAALRQGGWLEWSSGAEPFSLAVRHEGWGARAVLRDVVRTVTSARIEARAPLGVKLALSHAVFRTRRGESLYLAESESDRLVLRALSGEGQRSKLEVLVPAGRGRVRATLLVTAAGNRPSAPKWTMEWIRRSRPAPRAAP